VNYVTTHAPQLKSKIASWVDWCAKSWKALAQIFKDSRVPLKNVIKMIGLVDLIDLATKYPMTDWLMPKRMKRPTSQIAANAGRRKCPC
jgi:hypothetical protein